MCRSVCIRAKAPTARVFVLDDDVHEEGVFRGEALRLAQGTS